MIRVSLALWAVVGVVAVGPAHAQETMRFWNLTTATVTKLSLAPPGTDQWGPNQCANDRDGSVDHDERLRLTGLKPGRYDVRLTKEGGPTCTVRDVELKSGGKYAFSLADEDLKDCH